MYLSGLALLAAMAMGARIRLASSCRIPLI